jgi:hypothetical protein
MNSSSSSKNVDFSSTDAEANVDPTTSGSTAALSFFATADGTPATSTSTSARDCPLGDRVDGASSAFVLELSFFDLVQHPITKKMALASV